MILVEKALQKISMLISSVIFLLRNYRASKNLNGCSSICVNGIILRPFFKKDLKSIDELYRKYNNRNLAFNFRLLLRLMGHLSLTWKGFLLRLQLMKMIRRYWMFTVRVNTVIYLLHLWQSIIHCAYQMSRSLLPNCPPMTICLR